jgi:hypothetical protein
VSNKDKSALPDAMTVMNNESPAYDTKDLPAILPEVPTGWTKHLAMHLNFGSKGGAASYTIKDPAEKEMPIGYHYDTRKGGETGFSLPDVGPLMNWKQLREMWPTWLEKQKAKAQRG